MKTLLAILLLAAAAAAQVTYGAPTTTVNVTFTLTVTGTGTGSITSADGKISACTSSGGTCSGSYLVGSSIVLTPTATGGSGFAWSSGTGGASSCSGAGVCTFIIGSGGATLTGVFTGSGGGAIQASPFFSLDLNSSTQYPTTINHGQDRIWDTPGAQWSFIETSNNTYSFTSLDTALANALANSVHTTQYALARTPNWASSNTNLTVAGALTSGTFTASETVIQTGSGVSATFVSYTTGVLTISEYSGTATVAGTWVGQTSGTVFTPSAVPAGCSYFSNGSTAPGSLSGQCAPPTDLASNGTGTDLIFRNWVAAIATHANNSTYLLTHAHIKDWEIWNEPDTTKFWIGTYDQLIRMEQDAYCIIKGGAFTITKTGEICAQVWATVTSVSLSAAIDTSATIVMPSYHTTTTAQAQCFLYSTGAGCTGSTSGNSGANQTDVINFHIKPGANAETQLPGAVSLIDGILQSAELAKPLYNTEGGFSASGWTGAYTDANMQGSYMGRFYALSYANAFANAVWYNWSPGNGGIGSPTANTAYGVVYNWMVGSTPGTLTNVGSVYTYTLTLPNGVAAAMIWDTSQSCSGTPSVCTFSTQTVNSSYLSYLDLYGNAKVSIVGHSMQVGIMPRLAQAQ